MQIISIVIPAYNEEAWIGELLVRIHRVNTESVGFSREIIIVDDGSTDRTAEIAGGFPGVTVIRQENQGKGAAVQAGVACATGDYILVQDADLEYSPADYIPMLTALDPTGSTAVYGSRVLGSIKENGWIRFCPGRGADQSFGPWMAGLLLSLVTMFLYGRWVTDTLTAYKVYPAQALKGLTVRTTGFETDHELTARLVRMGIRIREVPISYQPRSVEEGKKIRMVDGFIAVATLFRFRFAR